MIETQRKEKEKYIQSQNSNSNILSPVKNSLKEKLRDAYQHIQQNRGHLIKQGKKFGFNVKRFFVIKGDCLLYFKTKTQQKV